MSTYAQLLQRFGNLKEEVEAARELEVHQFIGEVVVLLARRGIGLDDLINYRRANAEKRPNRKAMPKYYDPETGKTWSGRGREPHWIKGKDRSRFVIGDQDM
ncbi:H-NS histone family protein [Burkholderia metallica]|uniref:H-NS histone family protein n=1 Tax=Burkholderia metallica TaxID=488729 RepID=UPI00157B8418|nr:H-NS histone family protein [Burkholderia metallica]NTZ83608.1 H-NS histone family protein [Burkholderia metallica]